MSFTGMKLVYTVFQNIKQSRKQGNRDIKVINFALFNFQNYRMK